MRKRTLSEKSLKTCHYFRLEISAIKTLKKRKFRGFDSTGFKSLLRGTYVQGESILPRGYAQVLFLALGPKILVLHKHAFNSLT